MAFEAAEDVRHLALRGVGGQAFDVERARGVARQLGREVVGLHTARQQAGVGGRGRRAVEAGRGLRRGAGSGGARQRRRAAAAERSPASASPRAPQGPGAP